jgi:hypothetical protein
MIERLTYRVSEFCEAVGIKRTKFYALVGNGAIKAVRLDGMTMVTGPEAERFIAELPPVLPKHSPSEDGQPRRGNEALSATRKLLAPGRTGPAQDRPRKCTTKRTASHHRRG